MVSYHSPTGVAAWTDLKRSLKDDSLPDYLGAPYVKTINGRKYWYDQYRIGNDRIHRYVGEDGPEMRDRLSRHEAISRNREQSRKNRSRLMRILRAEDYLVSDVANGQAVSAMAKVGVFRLGGTLVGTQAFRCYEGELGVRLPLDQAAMTLDIDIASFERLSIALDDVVDRPLDEVFRDLEFEPVPTLDPGKTWKWRQTTRETLVEFLTPSFEEAEEIRSLPALGVSAQSLHFLNYLIAEPIQVPFLYRSGVLVQVPRPERYAIHKLIVADRRRNRDLKSAKDLAQAEYLIGILLRDRPDDLREAYETAMDAGPAWRRHIASSLDKIPSVREILHLTESSSK
ncbi:nucleotidyltransferase family protein [Cohaesibacter intestini]|uniref:nucleotidyltransferase family protein n=1 Tax=Cohaesibacter intestini TaxID=2211145 RepID=UPI000DE9DCCE|nr:GSU2403 family nucleotidyltransferase fold protein [Cohaesibacter intestini]